MGTMIPILNQHVQQIDSIHLDHDYCFVETLKLRLASIYDSSDKTSIKIQVETVDEDCFFDTLIEIEDSLPWLDQTTNNEVVNFPLVSVDGKTNELLTIKPTTDDVTIPNDKCNTESRVDTINSTMEFQQSGTTSLE